MIDSSASCVAAIGMFDGVHLGHRALIDAVKKLAKNDGESTLIVTFNNHPLSVINPDKCPGSLMTVEERIKSIYDLGINCVLSFDFDDEIRHKTAHEFLTLLHDTKGVDKLILGFNQRFGSDCLTTIEEYQAAAKDTGVEIFRAEEYTDLNVSGTICSSAIRKAIKSGDIKAANKMLGSEYSITGEVVRGKQIGRTIGFPTANISPLDSKQLIPLNGVYAVTAEFDGRQHCGVMNIGTRPTVDNSSNPKTTLEVFFLDCEENLYNDIITVKFAHRIREERKFSNLTELKQQIEDDVKSVKDLNSAGLF